MRTKTTRITFGATALALTTAFVPAANAGGIDTVTGYCAAKAFSLSVSDDFNGAMTEASTTQASNGTPIGATVECQILVNGYPATPWYQFAGSNGVQGGTQSLQFYGAADDFIEVCKQALFADGFVWPTCVRAQVTDVAGGYLLVGKA